MNQLDNFRIMHFIEDGYYRYVNHKDQLLTCGFKSKDELIKNRESFCFDQSSIVLMKARYMAIFNNIIPPNINV